jgi:hypothetical protein
VGLLVIFSKYKHTKYTSSGVYPVIPNISSRTKVSVEEELKIAGKKDNLL